MKGFELRAMLASQQVGFTALALVASLTLGGLILSTRSAHAAFLITSLLAIGLLAIRPQWYVVAFWAFTLLGPLLFERISEIQLSLGSFSINPLGLLNGLLPAFYIATWVLRSSRPRDVPLRGTLIVLAAWATLSLLLSGSAPQGVRQWVTLLNWIAAYFLFIEASCQTCKPAIVARYMAVVAFLCATGVLWGAATRQGMPDYSLQQAYDAEVIYRATGFGTEAEGAGEMLAMFAVVCLAFIVGPIRRKKLIFLFGFLVLGVWCTHARTATLGLLVASLVVLWRAKRLTWASGTVAVGAAVVATITNPRFDLTEVFRGNVNEIVYANALWRIDAWNGLIGGLSLGSYVHGNGIGSAWQTLATSPHNEYLAYLTDFGVVGLGLLLAIIVGAFRYGAAVYGRATGDLARTWGLACMGIVVADAIFKMVGIPLSTPSASYSLCLALSMAYLSALRADEEAPQWNLAITGRIASASP